VSDTQDTGAPDTVAAEREARSLGWVPKERFRGSDDQWVDADTFLRRGKEIMPLLKATNARLEGELASLRGETQELKTLLRTSTESIEALKKYHTEDTKRAVEREVTRLKAAIVQAKKDDDHEAEVELSDQLSDAKASLKETPVTPAAPAPAPAAAAAPDPTFAAWAADNDWFGVDKRKTALALAIGQELNETTPSLKGKAFYERISEELEDTLGAPTKRASKVDSSGGGRGGGGGRSGGKTFADLPTDAREACAKFAEGLVGDGKAYKDMAAWQAAYAADYFAGE
jgi:hypothetical protein